MTCETKQPLGLITIWPRALGSLLKAWNAACFFFLFFYVSSLAALPHIFSFLLDFLLQHNRMFLVLSFTLSASWTPLLFVVQRQNNLSVYFKPWHCFGYSCNLILTFSFSNIIFKPPFLWIVLTHCLWVWRDPYPFLWFLFAYITLFDCKPPWSSLTLKVPLFACFWQTIMDLAATLTEFNGNA